MNPSNLKCDFCSEPSPMWSYPARSFVAYQGPPLTGESLGDWAACDACRNLIEAEAGTALAERSVDTLIRKHPELGCVANLLRNELAQLHRQFFESRNGPCARVA